MNSDSGNISSYNVKLGYCMCERKSWCFRKDELIDTEEVSVYDIKDHSYAKFRLGQVFVRVDSAQVCHPAL